MNFDAYIRVSRTGGREGDGFYSPDIQADVIGRLARANDLEIGETVQELNVSGGRATADRELERLVRKVEEGASGGVIAWKLSRFSRSLADGAATAKRIVDAGGRLITTDFDSGHGGSRVILGILLAIAEDERDRQRETFIESKLRAAARGLPSGPLPFGLRRVTDVDGKTLRVELDEPAAHAVRLAFSRRAEGASLREVIEAVEAESGRRFSRSSIRGMLSNVAYLGRLNHSGEVETVVNDAAWPAIVEQEVFDRAQRANTARRRKYATEHNGSLRYRGTFQGIITCAGCDHPLAVIGSGTGEKRAPHYICRKHFTEGVCPAPAAIMVKRLDGWLIPQLREREPSLDLEELLVQLFDAQAELAAARAAQKAWAEGADIAAMGADLYNSEAVRHRERVEDAISAVTDSWDEQDAMANAETETDRWRATARRRIERLALRKAIRRGHVADPVEERVELVWLNRPGAS